jgi:hypothetical protein
MSVRPVVQEPRASDLERFGFGDNYRYREYHP